MVVPSAWWDNWSTKIVQFHAVQPDKARLKLHRKILQYSLNRCSNGSILWISSPKKSTHIHVVTSNMPRRFDSRVMEEGRFIVNNLDGQLQDINFPFMELI